MKYDRHVPFKLAESVYAAEVEADYFRKVGNLAGVFAFASFMVLPVIRGLPIR